MKRPVGDNSPSCSACAARDRNGRAQRWGSGRGLVEGWEGRWCWLGGGFGGLRCKIVEEPRDHPRPRSDVLGVESVRVA